MYHSTLYLTPVSSVFSLLVSGILHAGMLDFGFGVTNYFYTQPKSIIIVIIIIITLFKSKHMQTIHKHQQSQKQITISWTWIVIQEIVWTCRYHRLLPQD